MGTYEQHTSEPILRAENLSDVQIGVDVGQVVDQLERYQVAPAKIGATVIAFSALPEELIAAEPDSPETAQSPSFSDLYDPKTTTITLPVSLAMPTYKPLQHPRTIAGRNSPPEYVRAYFRDLSAQTSRRLAGALAVRTVDAGYQTEQMKELQANSRFSRRATHTSALAVWSMGLYIAEKSNFTDHIIGELFALVAVTAAAGGIDWLAISESHRREKIEKAKLVADLASAVAASAPLDLVRITPRSRR